MMSWEDKLVSRFLRYAALNTASDSGSNTFPSTPEQMTFARMLGKELETIGLSGVEVDENGYVTATLPSNIPEEVPVVGFIAHYDTSPEFNGKDVRPEIINRYDGREIILNQEKNLILSPAEFPELKQYIGEMLITTDGTSLLGADDKAGIAEIVTALESMVNSEDIRHGKIRIGFTPDEEIGQGADRFDIQRFGAEFAFTIDGGEVGELEYENFNAARATIRITGKSVHPGTAKNKMVNALLVANQVVAMLPPLQRPENTELYEGFFHLVELSGRVAEAGMELLIRDFDTHLFLQKKQLLEQIVRTLNDSLGYPAVQLTLQDQYYNMREKIEPVMELITLAKKAMIMADVEPKVIPIRGGTDGARLSWMGLPCPNIFTGGHNFHGPWEYIPVSSMLKAMEVIRNICRLTPEFRK